MSLVRIAICASVFILVGCEPAGEEQATISTGGDTTVAVGSVPPAPRPLLQGSAPPPVSCPGTGLPLQEQRFPRGNGPQTLTVGGQQFSFAANSIKDSVVLRMEVPTSEYMEVIVTPVPDTMVIFDPPATIRIDARRCQNLPDSTAILQRDAAGEQLLSTARSADIFEAPVDGLSIFLLAAP